MTFKKLFLPAGITAAAAAAAVTPDPGIYFKELGLGKLLIIIIFLINGFRLETSFNKSDKALVKTLFWIVPVSLFAAPLLGYFTADLFKLTAAASAGLIIMSAAPTTVSSGIVITETSGGSRLWALTITITLSIAGIFTIPPVLGLLLSSSHNISIQASILFYKLLLFVLLPLIAGITARRIFLLYKKKIPEGLSYIPPSAVILIIWMTLSDSRDLLVSVTLRLLIITAAASLTVHISLLAVNFLFGKYILKLEPSRWKALIFTGSQKTLPVSVSVITMIGGSITAGIISCIVFHLSQVLLDSLIASLME